VREEGDAPGAGPDAHAVRALARVTVGHVVWPGIGGAGDVEALVLVAGGVLGVLVGGCWYAACAATAMWCSEDTHATRAVTSRWMLVLLSSLAMLIPNFCEEQVKGNGCEERRKVAYNEDVFAFAAFDAQLSAVDRRFVTTFHVLDDNLGQCVSNKISSLGASDGPFLLLPRLLHASY
jgi:hypothetical protein